MSEVLSFQNLNGLQKTAIFLMSMGEKYIRRFFEKMDDDEVRQISIAMSSMGSVPAPVVQKVLEEFSVNMTEPSAVVGSFEATARVLSKVLPSERQENIIRDIQGPAGRTLWDKLENVDEAYLASYLEKEYPQTVAVIFSRLHADYVAKVMAHLSENFAMDVIMRLLRLETVSKDILNGIEETLKNDFMNTLVSCEGRSFLGQVADIFNHLDRQTENKLMTGLFERNREMAEEVRSQMFTFEDIQYLNDSSIRFILRKVDRKKMALSLKGASDSLKQRFYQNLPTKNKEELDNYLKRLGAVRLKDVDMAQASVVDMIKDFAERGQIQISSSDKSDVWIE